MALVSLEIGNFRCIEHAEIAFDPRCTVIVGENAAGKTSILEAIHVLSSGRSFRTPRNELLVRDNRDAEFLLVARVISNGQRHTAGLKWSRTGRELRLNSAKCRGFAEVAATLPVQVIDPGTHRLLEDGPAQRRRFVDWGVFHVEHAFMETWRSFQTALAQRNAALKTQPDPTLIQTWDPELARTGEVIAALRDRYIQNLGPTVAEFSEALLGVPVTLTVDRGWDRGEGLADVLAASLTRDVRLKNTSTGPHRADLQVGINGIPARDRISRGQQKLLACSLVLAQLQHRVASGMDPATLLLDDPAAELDVNNLGKLMQLVAKIPAQLVVTAVNENSVKTISTGKMFHVEQGRVTEVL